MKKIQKKLKHIACYVMALVPAILCAQTSTENHIVKKIYKVKHTNVNTLNSVHSDNVTKIVQYFDGLGRPKQNITVKAGGNKEDIITHFEYDALGRQVKDFLPYAAASNGGTFRTGNQAVVTNQYYLSKYPTDFTEVVLQNVNAYSEKTLEVSPLNRVLEQAAPGKNWKKGTTTLSKGYTNGHTIKFEYNTNSGTEVKQYRVNTVFSNNTYTPTLVLSTNNSGNYNANTLYKTITKEENWTVSDGLNKTTEEFKNKKGQVVLKRTYNASIAHDTHYVYDDFGNLTYVIPPKVNVSNGVSSTELTELCYQYIYDDKNRLVEKKIPGKDWEYIVYNKLDRPVMTQDALQRASNQWLFTKYDALGRVAYTGEYVNNTTRIAMQNTVNTVSGINLYEEKSSSGVIYNYTNRSYPTASSIKIHTINYYDDYEFYRAGTALPQNIPAVYGVPLTSNVKGLPTGTKVFVLGTANTWITTVTYYNDKARPIYVYTKNDYLGTTDFVQTKLDFTGKVLETYRSHNKTDDALPTQARKDVFTYDHADRLKTQTQYLNHSTTGERIVSNTYDALGQLKSKGVGGKASQSRLQTIDYKYNVRGWLQKINQDTNNDNDLFNFTLRYDNPTTGTPLFNGNISQTSWNSLSADSSIKTYTYSYDALNRITGADDNTGHYNLNFVSYDKNGNIASLKRKGHLTAFPNPSTAGHWGLMDNLIYSYDSGNKLTKVTDSGNATYGFKDGTNLATEYMYDANGNMLTDANKGITAISYNHLNLPTQVSKGVTGVINFVYDAVGTKLEKKVSVVGGGVTTTQYAGSYIYKKYPNLGPPPQPCLGCPPPEAPGFVLEFFNHAEGYTKSSGGVFSYVYQYKDHLGNVRLSYSDSDGDGMISDAVFSDDFESASGWNGSGAMYGSAISAFDNTVKHSGNYSGRIDSNYPTEWERYVHSNQWVQINNSTATNYIISGWLFLENVSGNQAQLFLMMKDAGETGYVTNVGYTTTTTKGSWVYLEKTVSVPASTRQINFRIDNDKSGKVWFDDLRIRKVGTEIIEESNYYPFGLKHKGYNNVVTSNGNSSGNKIKTFQGQEINEELGLNWHSFKWRNYDASLSRFMNIDPLAEKFMYNSPYAFSENKVISHFELEGLEAVLAITMGKDVKYRGGILKQANSNVQHTNLQSGGANSFVNAFKTASASDPKGIGFVAIWGHGVPGTIWGSGSSGNTNVNTSDLSQLNTAIKNGDVSFASNAVIYIGNCNAGTCGTGDTRSFAAELSKITGASVIGGNASVGLGQKPLENANSMIFWMYNPNKDSFIEFENGLKVNSLGGSMDVIKLMNRVMNPPTAVGGSLTPAGIAPLNIPAPKAPTLQANANPIGWDYSGDKPRKIYHTPSENGFN